MPSHPSPLRYPGGKHSLAPLLADVLVCNQLHDGTIIEPFAGGAGASLRLMFDEIVSQLVLNDADPRLYAFWRAVLNQTEQLVRLIETTPLTMEQWQKCSAVYNSAPSRTRQLDLAFAVFYLNRCNRSGILMGGGPIGGHEQAGKWKLSARFNRTELISRIRRIAEYRDRISVSRLDARDLLEKIHNPAERLLVFLDPPYYQKGQRLYLNALDHKDHQDLAELLLSSPPFHWVLTYDDAEPIRKLYKTLHPRPLKLAYSAYKRRVGHELIIFDPRLKIPEYLLSSDDPMCLGFSSADTP